MATYDGHKNMMEDSLRLVLKVVSKHERVAARKNG